MSQSPEGSTTDFHAWRQRRGFYYSHRVSIPRRVHYRFPRNRIPVRFCNGTGVSQSPEGATSISTLQYSGSCLEFAGMSQSPDRVQHRFPRGDFLQQPRQSRSVSIHRRGHHRVPPALCPIPAIADYPDVSIPRRGHYRVPRCYQPGLRTHYMSQSTEGARSISTINDTLVLDDTSLSQSPEGATNEFHSTRPGTVQGLQFDVSIPRRGHYRFPRVSCSWLKSLQSRSLNPPKGPS